MTTTWLLIIAIAIVAAYSIGVNVGVKAGIRAGCKLTIESIGDELTAGTMTLNNGKINIVEEE